uniref:Uncharacterized protein n=1 Tax=Kalanchoe fedtschenkoi TaxID=63787 RepID=A0A7N0UMN2_KALFE
MFEFVELYLLLCIIAYDDIIQLFEVLWSHALLAERPLGETTFQMNLLDFAEALIILINYEPFCEFVHFEFHYTPSLDLMLAWGLINSEIDGVVYQLLSLVYPRVWS